MVLCCVVNLLISAHWYNPSIEYFVLHITFLAKENVVMALNHVLHCFVVVAGEKYFFSKLIASFVVNLGSFDKENILNWWKIKRNW